MSVVVLLGFYGRPVAHRAALVDSGLFAGERVTYTVAATPSASRSGPVSVTAGATCSVPDPQSANNLATAVTTITK